MFVRLTTSRAAIVQQGVCHSMSAVVVRNDWGPRPGCADVARSVARVSRYQVRTKVTARRSYGSIRGRAVQSPRNALS